MLGLRGMRYEGLKDTKDPPKLPRNFSIDDDEDEEGEEEDVCVFLCCHSAC